MTWVGSFESGQGRLLGGGNTQLRAERRGVSHPESQGKSQAEGAAGGKVLGQERADQRGPGCPACPSNSLSNLTGSPDISEALLLLRCIGLCVLPSCKGHKLDSTQLSSPSWGGVRGEGRQRCPHNEHIPSSSTIPISHSPGSGTGLSMTSTTLPRSGRNPTAEYLPALGWRERR